MPKVKKQIEMQLHDKVRTLTDEQISGIAEVMFLSGMDFVETGIPQDVEHAKRINTSPIELACLQDRVNNAVEFVSWNLSILYAQHTGDGIGTGDIDDYLKIDDLFFNWFGKMEATNFQQFLERPKFAARVKKFVKLCRDNR